MAGTVDPPSGTPETRRQWLGVRPIWLVVLGIVVAALAIAGGWGLWEVSRSCGSTGSGVYEVDGECVGITDGSYFFEAEFANAQQKVKFTEVQQKIANENARVRAESARTGSPYVNVALLDPLTPKDRSGLPRASILHRLEGAYTALRRINTQPGVAGDIRPQIQLVLANWGSTDDQWQRVFDRLVEMSERDDHPLVAVIGLGYSTEHTQLRVTDLSRHDIPMVSSYLIADALTYQHIPGLIRISPANQHYVKALADYPATTDLDKALMVRDSNSGAGRDLFTKTLEDNFNQQIDTDFYTQTFTGSTIETPADPNLFDDVVTNICAAAGLGPEVVLYAGREVDLDDFLRSLRSRVCDETPLTIATAGVDLGEILKGQELSDAKLSEARLRVIVASTVDAEGWARKVNGTPQHYEKFQEEFRKEGFDPEHLDDANAITMHDAMLATAGAVRLAAPEGSESFITAADVKAQLLNLNTQHAVRGASGTLNFSFGDTSTGTGVPVGKPIPVLQYPAPNDSPSRQVWSLYCVVECVED